MTIELVISQNKHKWGKSNKELIWDSMLTSMHSNTCITNIQWLKILINVTPQ